jgi:hypothetical protein
MSDPEAPTDEGDQGPEPEGKPDAFAHALDVLEKAPGFAKPRYQTDVFRLATEELDSDEGTRKLRAHARRFDAAGVFHGGPWERADRLIPELVGTGLLGEGMYPTVEALSELRMLAIAAGEATAENVSPEDATDFLRSVMGLNLDLLYGADETEAARLRPHVHARAQRVMRLIEQEISAEGLAVEVLEEIEQRAAQRCIQVDVLRRLVHLATRIPGASEGAVSERLDQFLRACDAPTQWARESDSFAAYRDRLRTAEKDVLEAEARRHGELLGSTGLSNGFHAVLLRRIRRDPGLVGEALGLSDVGRADADQSAELLSNLIACAIHPATADAIYGLSQLIERSLLSRPEVAASLAKLVDLDLRSDVRSVLVAPLPRGSGVTANGALVAGALALLGQPLGVGQGANPTCVAARALSMWSLHAPAYLLDHVVSASRDGTVEIPFEGQPISSRDLKGGVAAGGVDPASLDPISRILVPHLDRIYDEMMRRASLRGEDPHKWVNPALYGHWVPNGFASIFDLTGAAVVGFADFVRLFYATHHPAYVDHHELIYPNPVGIFVTDVHGNMLGYHAVSIQRVATDAEGDLRVYFFNPNNEGRQRWGRGVEPTVYGHDEVPGESSLPFHHFAAQLYAFHYNPYEVGDGYAVPDATIASIEEHVKETWGREFAWH